jgi:Na+/H+-dicarboxylate symporter
VLLDFLLLLLAAGAAYALHTLVVIPALLGAVTRRNPYRYLLKFRAAYAKAFRAGSSEEALDATVEAAVDSGELSAAVAGASCRRVERAVRL